MHKAVATKHQDKKNGKLVVVSLDNDDVPDGLPAVHTDRHIYPNNTRWAATRRAWQRSIAPAPMCVWRCPGADIFAEQPINAQGFKEGLDGEYLSDSVEQIFTQSGWSTTVECNGGKQGKSKAKGRKKKQPQDLKVVALNQ